MDADDAADKARFRVKFAIYASLIANLCLAALQLYAAASSLSLSFFATAADSGTYYSDKIWPYGTSFRMTNVGSCLDSLLLTAITEQSLILVSRKAR